ncbi:very-long-chain 3-oxoacyl- reductase 1-like [Chlorella sorokiniana]|uniref:Very-long-chain 3-oxoacyl-reductase 1-like n=1 Tax=Chlorella sorokiniana TaxID=3076 RepID=A0A2P6TV83_CHLSO|nr:very-long-chain 3-oxoacyl- reductase 1-like [Chlorella sorokiniana]|eukprot:PRW57982.1 very-long-chain 3-oxoacyl- reductase 1-like [Chlorella sorokiniana]
MPPPLTEAAQQHAFAPLLPLLASAFQAPGRSLAAALALLALWQALRLVRWAARFIYVYFLRPPIDPRSLGSWAVITGATDGIGKALSHRLAQKGMNILLVARCKDRLTACAAELQSKHGVQTRTCLVDLQRAGPEDWARIEAAMQGLQVGILLNNAGAFYEHPDYLETLSAEWIQEHLWINCLAPTVLCKMVLPRMKARGKGLIVNIGSGIASAMPEAPLLSAYGAAKSYVDSLSRSLDAEASTYGVRVQNMWPMFVYTKIAKLAQVSFFGPLPDVWAAAAMRQLGHDTCITPLWVHGFALSALRLMPETGKRVMRKVLFESRDKALAKQAAAAAATAPKAAPAGVAVSAVTGSAATAFRRRK